jgi:hypothetical protein
MTEKFPLILVTRSNLGVVERSLYLTFPLTQTQIFLRTSKMIASLCISVSFTEAFLVKFRVALPAFVPAGAVRNLTEIQSA